MTPIVFRVMIDAMSGGTRIFALAALTLLLVAGADLLIIDFGFAFICDGGPLPDDECFCCCAHIVVPDPPVSVPAQAVQAFDLFVQPAVPSPHFTDVYHPPRA